MTPSTRLSWPTSGTRLHLPILARLTPSNYEQIKDFIHDAVDEEITLDECDTYSFNPDPDNNPFMEEGTIT